MVARLIPVLDIMNGQVVRGIAGQRHRYQPIKSRLTESTAPVHVAQALFRAIGTLELYVADLDRIQTGLTPSDVVERLIVQLPGPIWLDAGWRSWPEMGPVSTVRPVLASETLTACCWSSPPAWITKAAFSLDLHQGRLVGAAHQGHIESVVDSVVERGIGTIIVLDLAAVGLCQGPVTTERIRWLRKRYPRLQLLTGGGVRGPDDVHQLSEAGADGILVASALHDGLLP